jgi:predicted N-acyltransferase
LFPAAGQLEAWPGSPTERLGCQFHWFNQAYESFDHFLAQFNSRKRKTLLRERRKAAESGLTIEAQAGTALDAQDWQAFYQLYQHTYHKRSGRNGYLTPAFFAGLAAALPGQVQVVCARDGDQQQAAALYFNDSRCLYGRYWGALADYDSLHFECCYYQGVELAIRNKLERFDPGAQGEHKIPRGFTPVLTHSFHQIAHPEFARAIDDFCRQETAHIETYCEQSRQLLPFKDGVEWVEAWRLIR